MQMLVKLIFITAAYMHNFAKASDGCGKPPQPENTVPLTDYSQKINDTIRLQCANGYIRKAGTSSMFRCRKENGNSAWHNELPLKCIPDPKISPVAPTVAETQSPHKQTTLCTTEKTSKNHPTLPGTSSPTTETGHIALTTLEVVTTKTRRTTSQPTLMSTTKETESITTTIETTTSYTSRKYMTTTSSHALSGSFTTTTGLNASVTTSNISKEGNPAHVFNDFTPTVSGVTILIFLLVALAVFIFWLRKRNPRSEIYQPTPNFSISYTPVCESELNSAQLNTTSENSREGCVIDNNSGIPNHVDTCDEFLPQTDS